MIALAAVIGALTACGTSGGGTTQSTPRACALLTDAGIAAATGETPSSVGGGDSDANNSTCSWALPNSGGGSITVVETACTSSVDCDTRLAALASPASSFSAVSGIGRRAMVDSSRDASGGIIVTTSTTVVRIVVNGIDRDPHTALRALARLALTRVS